MTSRTAQVINIKNTSSVLKYPPVVALTLGIAAAAITED